MFSPAAWRACFLLAFSGTAFAQAALPPEVEAALARAKVPREAISVLVVDAQGHAAPRISHRVEAPLNPASIAKLATTFAGLEILGPSWRWTTPVYVEGAVRDGVLHGNLYIKGQGDPKLVLERMWLLLRRVQGIGIRQVAGDIVLDHTAFEVPANDPAAFDGEPLRPYNAAPDALLLNYKSVIYTFTPAGDRAAVQSDPPLAGVQVPASVPVAARAECADWRGALKADFGNPLQPRFAGAYPSACGEGTWPVAYPDPASYASRAVLGMWQQLGGSVGGQVRDGRVPPGLSPAFEAASPPLSEIVRDINKFSNNLMARQLFLTLGLQQRAPATVEASREVLRRWWQARFPGDRDPPVFDNGSGLSRDERITAAQLGRLLQAAWASPLMPELAASLPVVGVDGTLKRARAGAAQGLAHLKTGSLRDVAGVAGFVHASSGKRYVLVAIVNHPQANAARPAIDALIEWTARD